MCVTALLDMDGSRGWRRRRSRQRVAKAASPWAGMQAGVRRVRACIVVLFTLLITETSEWRLLAR